MFRRKPQTSAPSVRTPCPLAHPRPTSAGRVKGLSCHSWNRKTLPARPSSLAPGEGRHLAVALLVIATPRSSWSCSTRPSSTSPLPHIQQAPRVFRQRPRVGGETRTRWRSAGCCCSAGGWVTCSGRPPDVSSPGCCLFFRRVVRPAVFATSQAWLLATRGRARRGRRHGPRPAGAGAESRPRSLRGGHAAGRWACTRR